MTNVLQRPIQFKISNLLLLMVLVCFAAAMFGLNRQYSKLAKDTKRIERQQVTILSVASDYQRRLEALENYPPSPHAQEQPTQAP